MVDRGAFGVSAPARPVRLKLGSGLFVFNNCGDTIRSNYIIATFHSKCKKTVL